MLKPENKSKIIKAHNIHETDTGSPEVQIALLSEQIDELVSHLKKHPKDFHSKRGLIKMVVKRKKLLTYLKKVSEKRYKEVAKKLGLKK
jgi:small subunit ribosomal protein S15